MVISENVKGIETWQLMNLELNLFKLAVVRTWQIKNVINSSNNYNL